MNVGDSNPSHEPNGELPPGNYETVDWGLFVFIALGFLALLIPHISIPFVGLYWAAFLALAIFVVWIAVMPTTCMNGGLICSLVAMAMFFNTMGIVVASIIRFVVSLLG